MKKTFIYIITIAAAALATGCMDRNVPEIPGENSVILSLSFDAAPETRATAGVGLENAVTSVDYFFYTDTTQNAAYFLRDPNPTLGGSTTNPEYVISFTAGADGMPDLNTLFEGGKCEFFAVFNAPTAIENAPLSTIKAIAVANSFAHEGETAGASTGSKWVVTLDEEASQHPKYFVMTGQKTLEMGTTGNFAVQETVDMRRIAAKVGVDLKILKEVTDVNGDKWVPMLGGDQVRIYMQNAVSNSLIGAADAKGPSYPTALDQFTYKEVALDTDTPTDGGTTYDIENQQDFYTYPMTWDVGSDKEPFIKVIVPWRKTTGSTKQREIYYKIIIPVDSILANTYYQMTATLSVLGTEGEPEVTLTPLSAKVVGWQGGGKVNPVIAAAKYLSVERGVTTTAKPDSVVFYTPTDGTGYAASDPVTVEIIEIRQKNLTTRQWEYLYQNGTVNESEITKRGFTQAQIEEGDYAWVQKVGADYLQIGHMLNSDLTSTLMDVTPYYYTVKLSLPEDIDPNHEYDKTVLFIQYPEVYVVEDPNRSSSNTYGYAFLNTYTGSNTVNSRYYSTNYYTKVDGSTYYASDGYLYRANYLGGIHGLTGNNANPSMYVLTVSVSSTYIIGDPRSASTSTPSFTYTAGGGRTYNYQGTAYYESGRTFNQNWNSAPWTEGGNHTLSYYHAASSSNTASMIAPKIRVASSYGVCTTGITESNAIARCAAYQEDGIPAGRWRLPTMAEVQFIGQLSSLGRIPYLFGTSDNGQPVDDDSYYWTANGLILINNGTKTAIPVSEGDGTESVRCVYDEWFWGDATTRPVNAGTFTWGDKNY